MTTFALATFAVLLALAALRAPIFVWSAAVGVLGAAWAVILGFGATTNVVLAAAFLGRSEERR